jgi:shikimate kinase
MEHAARHAVLVGAMGSGKTTVGVKLAAALKRRFVDNDEQLQRMTGRTAAQLEARDGIDALHRAEAEAVLEALRSPDPAVIAAAASTIVDPVVRRDLAARAFVVWLRADARTLAARTPQSSTRPFANDDPVLLVAEQARERDPLFARTADLVVESGGETPDAVVLRILDSLRAAGYSTDSVGR